MDSSLLALILPILIGISLSQATPATYQPLAGYRYNPQFCGDTLSGRQLYVGEVFTRPGQCLRVQCLGTLQLWEDSCKVPSALKGSCNVLPPTEINLDYPRCCPLYECKSYESNSQAELETTNTYDHNGNLRKSHVTEVIVITKDRRLGPDVMPTSPARKYQV